MRIIYLLLLLVPFSVQSNTTEDCLKRSIPPITLSPNYSSCVASIEGNSFLFYGGWKISHRETGYEYDLKTKNWFIDDGFFIQNIRLQKIDGDILLSLFATDHDTGVYVLLKYDISARKFAWQSEIPGINLSELLIDEKSIYYGLRGVVGKIERATGKIVWEHEGLYRRGEDSWYFNGIEKIEKIDGKVIFTEQISYVRYPPHMNKKPKIREPEKIIVNDKTGEIISK